MNSIKSTKVEANASLLRRKNDFLAITRSTLYVLDEQQKDMHRLRRAKVEGCNRGTSDDGRSRGCFPGESKVQISSKKSVRMDELRPGDSVYSVDSNGHILPDTILAFMDIRSDIFMGRQASRQFVSITTDTGHTLRLTRNHIIHITKKESTIYPSIRSSDTVFAGRVRKGDFIFVENDSTKLLINDTVRPTKVIKVERVETLSGAYAPLTNRGTILVDGAMVSCYALFKNEKLAHLALAPARVYHKVQNWVSSFVTERNSTRTYSEVGKNLQTEGVMPYAELLYIITHRFIPEPWFWGD